MSVPEPLDDAAPTGWRGLLDGLGEGVNPVLLRDLRVYAKGRLLLSAYFLAMAALVLLAILFAVTSRYEGGSGNDLLWLLTILLAEVVGALVPNLVFERFRTEFGSRATELALMSPLTPARLVRGKLMGAWCVSLVVLATAMPMFATAYLLGGVNLYSIFGILACVLLAALVMPTAQLCMATQKSGRAASRILASLVFIAQICVMWGYAYFIYELFVEPDHMDGFGPALLFSQATGGVLVAQFLYFVTVGRLRSEAENRDMAPRLSLTAAAFAGGLAAVGIAHGYGATGMSRTFGWTELMGTVACFVSFAFCLGFLLVSHSSPKPPRNLRRNWRDKPLRRLLLLPGIRSLSAYFLVNALVILFFCLAPVLQHMDFAWSLSDEWRFACVGMAPLMAVALGMNLYRYLALPHAKDKRNPNLLPMTIIVGNLLTAIAAVFLMVVTAYSDDLRGPHLALAASNPVGLLYGASMSRGEMPYVGVYGLFFLMAHFALLLPALLRGEGDAKGGAPDAP